MEKDKLIDFEDFMKEELQDKELVEHYLNEAMQEDDPRILTKCLLQVIKAQGGVAPLAENIGMTRQGLYHTLSKNGNIKLVNLKKLLENSGLRLRVEAAG